MASSDASPDYLEFSLPPGSKGKKIRIFPGSNGPDMPLSPLGELVSRITDDLLREVCNSMSIRYDGIDRARIICRDLRIPREKAETFALAIREEMSESEQEMVLGIEFE